MNEEFLTDEHELARVEFRGSASEWFGIWLVNLLLNVLTFGIYSPWAKVRTQKYFYQNTYLGGRNFNYHATGMQIFIGRLVVVVALIAFNVVIAAVPAAALAALPVMLFLFPFLLLSALKFRARNSSWANVRFSFTGGYWHMFALQLIFPIIVTLTLFTTSPFLERAYRRYLVSNHKLGTKYFDFDAPIGGFYKAVFAAIGWAFLMGFSAAVLATIYGYSPDFSQFFTMDAADAGDADVLIRLLSAVGPLYLFFIVVYLPALLIYAAMIRNIVYNHTILEGGHMLHSYVSPLRYVWIAISNAIISILTLGLALPWAKVRLHRYLCMCTGVSVCGEIDLFSTESSTPSNAVGDAYVDIEGFDLGIG